MSGEGSRPILDAAATSQVGLHTSLETCDLLHEPSLALHLRHTWGSQLASKLEILQQKFWACLQAETGSSVGNRPARDVPQPSEKGLGMLGSWLRRSPQQQQDSSILTVKTNASLSTPEPGTPTWSEASEVSDFASEASPAAKAASAAAAFDDPQAVGQQSQARLAGRLGGWFTGVTTAAGNLRNATITSSSCVIVPVSRNRNGLKRQAKHA